MRAAHTTQVHFILKCLPITSVTKPDSHLSNKWWAGVLPALVGDISGCIAFPPSKSFFSLVRGVGASVWQHTLDGRGRKWCSSYGLMSTQ
jgi:hypothetical protein